MMSTPLEKPQSGEPVNMAVVLEQLTKLVTLQQTQMAAMQNTAFTNPQPTQSITPHVAMSDGVIHPNPIDVKMDSTNYTYWCQAVEMHVKGRERMKHLMGDPAPPLATSPEFHKWEVNDVIVKGWLINSLEPWLRNKYIRHPTARDVWKALATTYYDESDETQIFALNRKVTRLKQEGKTVEEFYDELQTLWQEIDFRCPNPVDTPGDIDKFNLFI
jgi:gag-polypeptide of LTR copia-type